MDKLLEKLLQYGMRKSYSQNLKSAQMFITMKNDAETEEAVANLTPEDVVQIMQHTFVWGMETGNAQNYRKDKDIFDCLVKQAATMWSEQVGKILPIKLHGL